MNQLIYKYNRLHDSRFNIAVLGKRQLSIACKVSPSIKKYTETRTGKLTHDFHCRLNYAASVGCGADGGLDFGDILFVAVWNQQSSCAPSVGDHTFWDF